MEVKKNQSILVIGGTGFIGSAIVRHAVSLGWDVDSLGLSLPDFKKKIAGVNYLKADITKIDTLSVLKKRYEYVVNTGGYIDHSPFSEGGDKVIESHFLGLQNLLKVINRENLIRFIQIGSSDEYGNTEAPQSEETREEPISPYSAAKVASTQLLQMLYRTEDLPSVTLRLFLCYGPGQDRSRFLPYLISSCASNEVINISPGEQLRDYCFINDIVSAVFVVLFNEQSNGRVFNIASGEPIPIKEIVERVIKKIGKGKPNFGAVPYRDGENMKLYADIGLAKKVLSWKPEVSLEEGLNKTIEYYLK